MAFVTVHLTLRRHSLPAAVQALGHPRPTRTYIPAKRLGKVVVRILWTGPRKPRCLFTALVTYRLLRAQGDKAELVIGLPEQGDTKDAHAWVEIDGVDIGPPPGRSGHAELARYGI